MYVFFSVLWKQKLNIIHPSIPTPHHRPAWHIGGPKRYLEVSVWISKLMPGTAFTWKCCHPWITWWFSNTSVHKHHLGFLLNCRYRFKGLGWSLGVCISDKLPGDTNIAGPQGTLWKARDYMSQMFSTTLVKSRAQEPLGLDMDCSPLFHSATAFSRSQPMPSPSSHLWGSP